MVHVPVVVQELDWLALSWAKPKVLLAPWKALKLRGNLTVNVVPLVKEGKLRAFAVTSLKRSSVIPELPSVAESGLPGFEALSWFGLLGPVGTPKPIVAYLNKHLNEVLQTDTFKKPMAELGMAPPPAADNTPEKFDKFMRDEIARQGPLAELTGQKLAPPKQ